MQPGSRWRHYLSGAEYKLLGAARLVRETGDEPILVYKEWGDGTDYGPWWAMSWSLWNEEVKPGVRRFVLVADAVPRRCEAVIKGEQCALQAGHEGSHKWERGD